MNVNKLYEFLSQFKAKLSNGIHEETTPRKLLEYLGVSRRGANINAEINELLDKYNLTTEPNFELAFVDNAIYIKKNSVMTYDRTVKGVVTWKSIGSKLFEKEKSLILKDVMDKPIIIDNDESLFKAIEKISFYDYVLIRARKDFSIKGIVTSSDLSQQFKNLSEPFLLIGRRENLMRLFQNSLSEVFSNSKRGRTLYNGINKETKDRRKESPQ